MRQVLIGLVFFVSSVCSATVKVAVIDTGYSGMHPEHLCATGHHNFIDNTDTIGYDLRYHGTHVIDAIGHYASGDYCILVYKVFEAGDADANVVAGAINKAVLDKVDVINLSMDSFYPSELEKNALSYAVNNGVKVFVAAGNKGVNLDIKCNVYPACYKLSISVVTTNEKKRLADKGSIAINKEPWCYGGICGTSLSTGIATGKWITNMFKYGG